MKEKQLLLGTRVFPIAWKWWNSPACNALIHLARLIDNPDSFADNLMASILRLKFNNLAPFEKTGFVTSWSKECHVMLGMNFPKLF